MATDKYDSTQILPRVYVEDDKIQGLGHLKTSITDGQNSVDVNSDGSINVVVVDGGAANVPVFYEQAETLSGPSGPTEVLTYVALTNQSLTAIHLTASTGEAIWYIKLDGTIVRMGRSSPAQRNITIDFKQARPMDMGTILTVEFEIKSYNQNNPLEYQTFVAFEGYNRS